MKLYICETCGNIIEKVNDSGVPVVCCGKPMKELIAGTVDAAREKHIPVYTVEGNKVSVVVGSVEHPMVDVHYIDEHIMPLKNLVKVNNTTINQ